MTKRSTISIAIAAVLVIGSGAAVWALVANDAGQSNTAAQSGTAGDADTARADDAADADAAAPADAAAESPSSADAPAAAEQGAGAYVDYSADVIAETAGDKVLFFHAPWCPNCRALESDIEASGVPAGLTIIKVDYDSEVALKQKYGVTLQTTVVYVDDEGDKLSSAVLYDESTLDALLAAAP